MLCMCMIICKVSLILLIILRYDPLCEVCVLQFVHFLCPVNVAHVTIIRGIAKFMSSSGIAIFIDLVNITVHARLTKLPGTFYDSDK